MTSLHLQKLVRYEEHDCQLDDADELIREQGIAPFVHFVAAVETKGNQLYPCCPCASDSSRQCCELRTGVLEIPVN